MRDAKSKASLVVSSIVGNSKQSDNEKDQITGSNRIADAENQETGRRQQDKPQEVKKFKNQVISNCGTIRTGFWLTPELVKALDIKKALTGIDKSKLVEDFLREALDLPAIYSED